MILLTKPILDEMISELEIEQIAALCAIANASEGEPVSDEDATEKANTLTNKRKLMGDQLTAEHVVNLLIHEIKTQHNAGNKTSTALTPEHAENIRQCYRVGGRFNDILLSLTNTPEDRPHPFPKDFSMDDMIAFLHIATIEEKIQINPEKFDAAIERIMSQHTRLIEFAQNHQKDRYKLNFKNSLKVEKNIGLAIFCHYISVTALQHPTLLRSSQHHDFLTAIARISLLELKSAPLTRANLQRVDLTHLDSKLERCVFNNNDLSGAVMTNLKINHATFTQSNLSGADFTGTEMTCVAIVNSDLSNTILTNITLTDSRIIDVDLSNQNLDNITINGNSVIQNVKILGIPQSEIPCQTVLNTLLDNFKIRAETAKSVDIFRLIAVNELAHWIANHQHLDQATKLDLLQQAKRHPVFALAANNSVFGKLFKPKQSTSQKVLDDAMESIIRSAKKILR